MKANAKGMACAAMYVIDLCGSLQVIPSLKPVAFFLPLLIMGIG